MCVFVIGCDRHHVLLVQVLQVASSDVDDESGASIWDSALCLGEILVKQQTLSEQIHTLSEELPASEYFLVVICKCVHGADAMAIMDAEDISGPNSPGTWIGNWIRWAHCSCTRPSNHVDSDVAERASTAAYCSQSETSSDNVHLKRRWGKQCSREGRQVEDDGGHLGGWGLHRRVRSTSSSSASSP